MSRVVENPDHFPPDAVIMAVDEEHKVILRCMKTFLSPEVAFMKLERAKYFAGVFDGSGEIPPTMDYERDHSLPPGLGGTAAKPDFERFVKVWRNPGFTYRNDTSFVVRPDKLGLTDPLRVDLGFKSKPEVHVPDDLLGTTIASAIEKIQRMDLYLDPVVLDRLQLVIESDNLLAAFVKQKLVREPDFNPTDLVLVSGDKKLFARLIHVYDTYRGAHNLMQAVIVDPIVWLQGQYEFLAEGNLGPDPWVLVDPGSVFHADLFFSYDRKWIEGELCMDFMPRQPAEGLVSAFAMFIRPVPTGSTSFRHTRGSWRSVKDLPSRNTYSIEESWRR
jgi:hypothetical protein